jgi:predicted porin
MKKTLIALAAVAATGAAFAQSSVTLYGVADLSIADNNVAGTSYSMSGNGLINNGSSRIGFRGVEDLGGGLKASFNFEQQLNLENGTTQSTCAIDPLGDVVGCTPTTFARAAWMSIGGGFGEVKLGRTLNPSFYAAAAWELTGAANYSAVVSQFGAVLGGVRNSSQFAYTTPKMGGFSATLGYVFEDDNDIDPDTTVVNNQSKVDLNVLYASGPIGVGFGYNKVSTQEKNWHVGGRYDFGAFKVAGAWIDPAGDKKGFSIGGSTNLGPVGLTLDIARDTGSATKSTDYVLEAKYALSKRTFAYGVIHRDGSASVTSNGVGIRHNF